MQKIIKKKLSPAYTAFGVDTLQIDSVVGFDCYIKRFNGYVIIIEQGTLITEKLYEKIKGNEYLYVHESELNKHKAYCKAMQTLDAEKSAIEKAIENVIALPELIGQYKSSEEKLHLIYQNACDLGYLFFNAKVYAKLPLKALNTFIDVTLKLIVTSENLLPKFLKMMPDKYHIEYHSVNVSILSMFLGHKIGFLYSDLQKLAMAGVLHDIGKLQIERSILEKDGTLAPEEFEVIQEHAAMSMQMASQNDISDRQILSAILYHHEKFDGTGYPEGLEKHDIPKMAQIIGICDAFDALTTDRTFRERYSSFDALKLMRDEMSQQLNQMYIKSFIQLLRE